MLIKTITVLAALALLAPIASATDGHNFIKTKGTTASQGQDQR